MWRSRSRWWAFSTILLCADRQPTWRAGQTQLEALRADIAKGQSTANQLNEFDSRSPSSNAAREPESGAARREGHGRSSEPHSDAGHTVEHRDPRFQARADGDQKLHAEWPIQLELDGTYHNLAMFFDRVSKFSRIMNVSTSRSTAKEKPEATSTITVDCIATTFVLLDNRSRPRQRRTDVTTTVIKRALPVVLLLRGIGAGLGAGCAGRAAVEPSACGRPARRHRRPTPPPAEPYTYDPAGRRDPFISLLARGAEQAPGRKTPGPLRARDRRCDAAGNPAEPRPLRCHGLRTQRQDGHGATPARFCLLDGVIRSVTASGIVIMQEVNDLPLVDDALQMSAWYQGPMHRASRTMSHPFCVCQVGSEHQRAGRVAAAGRHHDVARVEAERAGTAVEQRGEDAGAVGPGQAQPLGRPVGCDEGGEPRSRTGRRTRRSGGTGSARHSRPSSLAIVPTFSRHVPGAERGSTGRIDRVSSSEGRTGPRQGRPLSCPVLRRSDNCVERLHDEEEHGGSDRSRTGRRAH